MEMKRANVVYIHVGNHPLTFERSYQVLCNVAKLSVSVLLPMHVAPFPAADTFLSPIDHWQYPFSPKLYCAICARSSAPNVKLSPSVTLFSPRLGANVSPCYAIVGLIFYSAAILRIANKTIRVVRLLKEENLSRHRQIITIRVYLGTYLWIPGK